MRVSTPIAVVALLATAVPRANAAATHTFAGTCTARGTATFEGTLAAPTYVTVDTERGHCTGRLDGGWVVRVPMSLHAEATPELNGLRAHGAATVTLRGLTFHIVLNHVTPAHGIDTDGQGGWLVTAETPLEPPRCDGELPWETVPPVLPQDCTGTTTGALSIVARTLTPLHGS